MPLVITNAAQVTLNWLNQGIVCHNVLGASKPPGVTVTQALVDSLGAAIKTSYTASGLSAHHNPSTALMSVGVRDISSAGQPEYLDSGAFAGGTTSGEALPPQIAMVVSVRTARAGASYRGRIYLPGWMEIDNSTTGTALQPAADAAVAFIEGVSDAISAAGMLLAILSRPREAKTIPAKEIAPKAGFVTPATAVEIRNLLWDTQRRRGTSGGGSTFLTATTKRTLGQSSQARGARSS
jgi:hypothetical protein